MYEATTQEIHFTGGDGDTQAWLSRPIEPGQHPSIMLLHGVNGVSDGFRHVGVRFAEEGIAALAVNYMTQDRNVSNPDVMRTIEAGLSTLKVQDDIDPDRVVLSGYCKGGGLAYLGLADVPGFGAGVIFHGGLYAKEISARTPENPADAAARINVPIIILHGLTDPSVPIQQVFDTVRRLDEMDKHIEVKAYWGTGHAFTLPGGGQYVAEHAADAFREAVQFIRRTFGIPVGTVGLLERQPAAT